ncbi:hypothetical protein [Halioxenophilus aromaticivorans]|uniref:Nitrate/nitrite sensing protein domain-containing protein n=1 Tax=Halioxenophilus aromaticivorans TaxID=1306992 RepID=A0AAV3U3F9_9ALTE
MNNVELVSACGGYSERILALNLIKQISHLCRAIQRHRGLGMSLIAGYQEFETDFLSLQQQVSRRMQVLEVFSKQSTNLLTDGQIEKLLAAWSIIERDWQNDSVMENFEYHSHFIEQLLQMMMTLARLLERPAASAFPDAIVSSSANVEHKRQQFNLVGLLVFVCNQLPSLVEQVAKIRGLATLSATRGKLGGLEDSKLRYFIQNTRVQHEKVRNQSDRLLEQIKDDIRSLPLIKAYEFKLMFLINTVEKEILEPQVITMDSRQVFNLATEIIDVYLKVVDEGLSLLQRRQEDSLEDWFLQG